MNEQAEILAPDWTNRRKVVFYSLAAVGSMAGLIVLVSCVAMLINTHKTFTLDLALVNLISSAFTTLSLVGASVIGSYVFGANFDYANFRSHAVRIAGLAVGSKEAICDESEDKAKPDPEPARETETQTVVATTTVR